MRARFAPAAAALVWATACSGDLFHTTDWRHPCAVDGCGGSSDGGAGAGGESGAGAAGTGAGGQGGDAGGDGGAPVGGAGGTGGSPGCLTCTEAVLQGAGGPDEPFCPMSADLYSAAQSCACAQNGCPSECFDTLCQSVAASAACLTCGMQTCSAISNACAADTGG
ncbi:MAG: hypothetical protein WKG00_29320 [Polyangiaceae bacterium]